jgi:hypothetical protein
MQPTRGTIISIQDCKNITKRDGRSENTSRPPLTTLFLSAFQDSRHSDNGVLNISAHRCGVFFSRHGINGMGGSFALGRDLAEIPFCLLL